MAPSQPGGGLLSLRTAQCGQHEGSEPVSRQARILLVDDREENLFALDAILSSLNQILMPVQSGERALRALTDQELAVVLLDIMMTGMDGFETDVRIKQDASIRDVPIMF